MKTFYLFLDESGNFVDNSLDKNPSLVGGMLLEERLLSAYELNKIIPEDFLHCNETEDSERYINILEWVSDKSRIVIFNNEERLSIVNSDVTYLNIVCEGLIQLLTSLEVEYGKVELNVICATRIHTEKEGTFVIDTDEYITRIEEKIALTLTRRNVKGKWALRLDSARKNKHLMLADVVCNTYLTQMSKKFDENQKERINRVFSNNKDYYYSVFEDATLENIKNLITEEKIGEAVYEVCAVLSNSKTNQLVSLLVKRLKEMPKRERDLNLEYVKNRIALLINTKHFLEVEKLLEGYDSIFLKGLEMAGINVQNLRFDIYFYLITLYTRSGNVTKSSKYIDLCDEQIECLGASWEGLGKYFSYQIRKCHNYINQFKYEMAVEFSTKIIQNLSSFRDVVSMIDDISDTFGIITSDLLAKAYGTRLQAYTSLIKKDSKYYDLAVEDFNWAIKEFTDTTDILRQYQYRCQIELEANNTDSAYEWLCKSIELNGDYRYAYKDLLKAIEKRNKFEMLFDIMHYTDIAVKLCKKNNIQGSIMHKNLAEVSTLYKSIIETNCCQHPMQIIFWNLAKINQFSNNRRAACEFYNMAANIALTNRDNFTMCAYGICILSDLAFYQYKSKSDYKKTLKKVKNELDKNEMLTNYFNEKIDLSGTDDELLEQLNRIEILTL